MDGGKSWFAGAANDKTVLDRVMLRFRPIAPKPTIYEAGSAAPPAVGGMKSATKRRGKRKYVRASNNSSSTIRCKRKKVEREKDAVLKLQLLPELPTPTRGTSNDPGLQIIQQVPHLPMISWLSFHNFSEKAGGNNIAFDLRNLTALDQPERKVVTCVTVECVTETCTDARGWGCTDGEKIRNLEADTCPGFVSDAVNRVQWVNLAYRRMVWPEEDNGGGGVPPQAVVQVVVKAKLPVGYPAFACWVRVQHTWQKEKHSQTVPCDVWRMDFGGLAWRLDVQAALSLGR